MPGVSIILPVQGHRAYSLLNWQSQLSMTYAGPVEYIFVVQSAADHAIAALQKLISCEYEAARTRIVVSGECQTCSQKIHNLRRGILEASQNSKYVLCLDDDIQLHPSFLQTAVHQLESDPSAFMLTGAASLFTASFFEMQAT